MKAFFSLFLILSVNAFALEIDEKLTARILKTSESKKTLLVNRGIEDGLAEGNHAKFVVTAGIVARAVCVKISPTRSVWSVYRLVNSDLIVNDAVMSLKITAPVKVTKDESQALVKEDTPTVPSGDPAALGIPLAEGAEDIPVGADKTETDDLKALVDAEEPVSLIEKTVELYTFVNFSALGTKNTNDAEFSSGGSEANYHLGVGGEWYSQKEREWYSRFSLFGSLAMVQNNSQGYNGTNIKNQSTEYNLGLNWHPFKAPSMANAFIPFFQVAYSFGGIKSTVEPGADNAAGVEQSADGKFAGFSFGFGYKYFLNNGFGARLLLDYYSGMEKYDADVSNLVHEKTVSGPRLVGAISYRF